MSSSIIRENLAYTRRERLHEIGAQGEINVGNLLAEHFGNRNVSHGFDNYSEGTNGLPDIVLKTDPPLAIEVKSTSTFVTRKTEDKTYRRNNTVAIKRDQWKNERMFAYNRNMKIILIVEVRLKNKGIYFWFNENMLKEFFEKGKGEWLHINIHDILNKGNLLIFPANFRYLEYWNVNTDIPNQNQIALKVNQV